MPASPAQQQSRATSLSLGAAFVAALNAMMSLFVSFGFDLNAAQQASISTVANSLVLLVLAAVHTYGQYVQENDRWSHLDGPDE